MPELWSVQKSTPNPPPFRVDVRLHELLTKSLRLLPPAPNRKGCRSPSFPGIPSFWQNTTLPTGIPAHIQRIPTGVAGRRRWFIGL